MRVEQISLLSFANQSQLNIKSNELQFSIDQKDTKKNTYAHLEYLLAGFAACVNMVGRQVADDLDMDLKSIRIEIKVTINSAKSQGLNVIVLSGFVAIDLVVKSVTTAVLSTLKFWM